MEDIKEDREEETGEYEEIDRSVEDDGKGDIHINDDADEKKEERIEGNTGEQDSLLGIDSVKADYKPDLPQEDRKPDNKDIEKMQEGQIKWAVFMMAAIVLIIVVVPFVNNNFIKQFDYNGISFQKTQLGEIQFYSAKFPIVTGTGQILGDYAVNLRNDPRDLVDIPVEVPEGNILFNIIRKGGEGVYAPTYITIDPFMEVCEDSGIALLTLSGFIKDSGPEVSSAVTDKAYARDNNVTHKWCDPLSTVFVVTDGEETKISQIQPNCYKLEFKDCEVLKVTEKVVLNVLEQYADRFTVE